MGQTTITPNISERKVIFGFDENKFAKTISRLTESLLHEVKISVWAVDSSTGHCTNVLKSQLQEDEFDQLSSKAVYTVYEGSDQALRKLGVLIA